MIVSAIVDLATILLTPSAHENPRGVKAFTPLAKIGGFSLKQRESFQPGLRELTGRILAKLRTLMTWQSGIGQRTAGYARGVTVAVFLVTMDKNRQCSYSKLDRPDWRAS